MFVITRISSLHRGSVQGKLFIRVIIIIIIIVIIIIITTILSSFSTGYCLYRLNHSSQLRDTTLSGRNRWAVPMNGTLL